MSDWKAGSDDDEGQEEQQRQWRSQAEAAASPPRPSSSFLQRLSKGEKRQLEEEESAYSPARNNHLHSSDGPSHGSASKKARLSAGDDLSSLPTSSVYERVTTFVAQRESRLAALPPAAAGSENVPVRGLTPGSGLTHPLTTQPSTLSSNVQLHPHQLVGVNWIKSRFEMGLNALLADEMGLGKTIQAAGFLAHLYELAHQQQAGAAANSNGSANGSSSSSSSPSSSPRVGPFLIISPLTVLDNWVKELERFTPCLQVQVYTGSKVEREEIQDDLRAWILSLPKSTRSDPVLPFHVLVTTYESILSDVDFLSRFKWRVAIVDEAHRLKNASSVLAQTLKFEYKIGWKLLLSGTPVQNNLKELWGMLWSLHPNLFGEVKQFEEEFAALAPNQQAAGAVKAWREARSSWTVEQRQSEQQEAMDRLHSVLRPFMLRRLLGECSLNLPPKREIILKTPLTALQKDIYKKILLKHFDLIGTSSADGPSSSSSNSSSNSRALLNIVQSLRKCATHPYLFSGVEPEPFVEGMHLLHASGKFTLLYKLLSVLHRRGHRVLLFSTSVQTLDVVQDAISFLGYTYERLDGSVRGEERKEVVQRFKGGDSAGGANSDKNGSSPLPFIFLLSTRAGGQGLNLVCADTVIFLDQDWNPQMDLQAQARAHRIGQTRPTLIIRLVATDTLEEIILKRTQKKLRMTHNILERGQFGKLEGVGVGVQDVAGEDPDSLGRSAQDLKNILQYGLANLFHEGDGDTKGLGQIDLTEEEVEAIITGEVEQKEQEEKGVSEREAPAAAASSSSAAAAPTTASAAPSARPSFDHLSSLTLPSLDAASNLDMDVEEEPTLYMYEGKDYKDAAHASRSLDLEVDLDLELSSRAQAGSKVLQRLKESSRAGGGEGEHNHFDWESDEDGPGNLNTTPDRRRKMHQPRVEETEEERAERIARNKELAARRAESARKNREAAAAAQKAALEAKWAQHHYESTSLPLDEALEAEFSSAQLTDEEQGEDPELERALQNAAADSTQSEWMAGGDEEEEEEEQKESPTTPKARLHHVVGDATFPFVFQREDGSVSMGPPSAAAAAAAASSSSAAASSSSATTAAASPSSSSLVFVPVDCSGHWGRGGLFRALDHRSSLIGLRYELVAQMEDLHWGDVHLINVPGDQLKGGGSNEQETESGLQVAVGVVLKRSKAQPYNPPSLRSDHLTTALQKLSHYARKHGCSIHLPRLGAPADSSDRHALTAYGVERLLQKYLVGRGVDTYVYYFRRQGGGQAQQAQQPSAKQYHSPVKAQLALKRGESNASAAAASQPAAPAAPAAAASSAATASSSSSSLDMDLQDIFTGCVVYLHRGDPLSSPSGSIDDASARLLTRFLSAYDGELSESITSQVTHIVTAEPLLTPELFEMQLRASPDAKVVKTQWVERSVTQGKVDDSPELRLE